MTPTLITKLKEAIAESGNTVFLVDGEQVYVHFEQLRIRPEMRTGKTLLGGTKYNPNKFILELLLNGEVVFTKPLNYDIHFGAGDDLTISNIEGVFPIDLN